jgi:solute carrier family 35, member F5
VPLRRPDGSRGTSKSSGTESDDSSVRSVRFSKLAEVRQMSEEEATAALMARLSYSASVRADQMARRAANKLPVSKVAWLALTFCILVCKPVKKLPLMFTQLFLIFLQWCIANFSYQAALEFGDAGLVSLLSCAAPLFTLLLSAAMPTEPMDRITLSKIAAVGLSIAGAVSYSEIFKICRVLGCVVGPKLKLKFLSRFLQQLILESFKGEAKCSRRRQL